MKILLGLCFLTCVLVGCNKTETPAPPQKSKLENGYSSMSEALDSLGISAGITYRFMLYSGGPSYGNTLDSGTLLLRLEDSIMENTTSEYSGAFKFYIPDFDKPAGQRSIKFGKTQINTNNSSGEIYPFYSGGGMSFITPESTYLTDPGHIYRKDTAKLIRTGENFMYTLFVYK